MLAHLRRYVTVVVMRIQSGPTAGYRQHTKLCSNKTSSNYSQTYNVELCQRYCQNTAQTNKGTGHHLALLHSLEQKMGKGNYSI